MSSPAEPVRLDLIAARVRAAVESVAASDPNPTDPFRGLYVTDELALAIARSERRGSTPTPAWPSPWSGWRSTRWTPPCWRSARRRS